MPNIYHPLITPSDILVWFVFPFNLRKVPFIEYIQKHLFPCSWRAVPEHIISENQDGVPCCVWVVFVGFEFATRGEYYGARDQKPCTTVLAGILPRASALQLQEVIEADP